MDDTKVKLLQILFDDKEVIILMKLDFQPQEVFEGKLIKGKTTKNEVISMYGNPSRSVKESWRYDFDKATNLKVDRDKEATSYPSGVKILNIIFNDTETVDSISLKDMIVF